MKVKSSCLAALTQAQLDTWAVQTQTHIQGGQLPEYIRLLAQANPSWFAVQDPNCGWTNSFGRRRYSGVSVDECN